MELRDFVIGETFWTHAGAFRCADIGTRVVVAVKLGPRVIGRAEDIGGTARITDRTEDDPSWVNGPPYAVEELVFDENDQLGCFRSQLNYWPTVGTSDELRCTASVVRNRIDVPSHGASAIR